MKRKPPNRTSDKSLIGGNPIIKTPPTHPNQLSIISYQLSVIGDNSHTPHPTPKKTMKCPQCQSSETYRKSPESMIIYCDNCGHQWEADQVMKSLASARKQQGQHRLDIDVYLCPIDKNKYSFAINKNGGVGAFYEFESDPYLSGCYESIEEALEAGIKEALL